MTTDNTPKRPKAVIRRLHPRMMSQRLRPSHTLGKAVDVLDIARVGGWLRGGKIGPAPTKKGPREIIFNDRQDHSRARRVELNGRVKLCPT